ncbi:unnamed protein product, partial [Protopolystoma xenopodis]
MYSSTKLFRHSWKSSFPTCLQIIVSVHEHNHQLKQYVRRHNCFTSHNWVLSSPYSSGEVRLLSDFVRKCCLLEVIWLKNGLACFLAQKHGHLKFTLQSNVDRQMSNNLDETDEVENNSELGNSEANDQHPPILSISLALGGSSSMSSSISWSSSSCPAAAQAQPASAAPADATRPNVRPSPLDNPTASELGGSLLPGRVGGSKEARLLRLNADNMPKEQGRPKRCEGEWDAQESERLAEEEEEAKEKNEKKREAKESMTLLYSRGLPNFVDTCSATMRQTLSTQREADQPIGRGFGPGVMAREPVKGQMAPLTGRLSSVPGPASGNPLQSASSAQTATSGHRGFNRRRSVKALLSCSLLPEVVEDSDEGTAGQPLLSEVASAERPGFMHEDATGNLGSGQKSQDGRHGALVASTSSSPSHISNASLGNRSPSSDSVTHSAISCCSHSPSASSFASSCSAFSATSSGSCTSRS